jgi:hypothetical protein
MDCKLDKKTKQDIGLVLDYLWHDEEKHYQESGYRRKHIFKILRRLAKTIQYEY